MNGDRHHVKIFCVTCTFDCVDNFIILFVYKHEHRRLAPGPRKHLIECVHFVYMAAFLSLPRVLQLMVCAYCDEMSENLDFFKPVVVTFYHDGMQILDQRYRGVSCYKFVFLPDWLPVEVHVYKMNGTVMYVQNEKMHAHKPLQGDDVGVVCKHSLIPLLPDCEHFVYTDVHKWWVMPTQHGRASFPYVFTHVNGLVVYKNALREFV